jgi:hypothetical protein
MAVVAMRLIDTATFDRTSAQSVDGAHCRHGSWGAI